MTPDRLRWQAEQLIRYDGSWTAVPLNPNTLLALLDLHSLASELVTRSPMTGSYESDWCFYCLADQLYDEGHSEDCMFVRLGKALKWPR